MTSRPLFTLPPLAKIARNALGAHARDELQATSSRHAGKGAHYYDPGTKCCCVIGASIPPKLAMALDRQEYPAMVDLLDAGVVVAYGPVRDQLRYLQRLHDSVLLGDPSGDKKRRLLDYLRDLAR